MDVERASDLYARTLLFSPWMEGMGGGGDCVGSVGFLTHTDAGACEEGRRAEFVLE
jgi:hypothetical protein